MNYASVVQITSHDIRSRSDL